MQHSQPYSLQKDLFQSASVVEIQLMAEVHSAGTAAVEIPGLAERKLAVWLEEVLILQTDW